MDAAWSDIRGDRASSDRLNFSPSLRNIYTELQAELDLDPPEHGNLEAWPTRACCG